MDAKKEIIKALNGVERDGIDQLKEFLNTSDFYTAPCSTKYHLAVKGGLALHTANVMSCALMLNSRYESPAPEESVIIAAVCHDLCKVDFYKESDDPITSPQETYLKSLLRNNRLPYPEKMNKAYASRLIDHLKNGRDKDDLPEFAPAYEVADKLPLGHGEKSLFVANRYIALTDEEALAIRWHLGSFDVSIHFGYPSGTSFKDAAKASKLVSILILADLEASALMEV